ncbi:hypothetical protein GWI33_018617 [Rhynchophorus ferrugineus]|uniref:AB hydrolase-1 domain-containing protein n=1 Tax=Rhynchophorus ferrugineus TaxID=354439 RepID=A0A834I6V0_RHYFE|nr:hypothetical protein GWI33_018617 [Rhynchophorus ferrugineus]
MSPRRAISFDTLSVPSSKRSQSIHDVASARRPLRTDKRNRQSQSGTAMAKSACIQSISVWGQIRIHVLSFLFGLWVLSKRLARWLWRPNGFSSLTPRDTPPPCLVDSNLGQHKYVKLKGVKLHYIEAGIKTNPVILLLHGFPDFWLSWRYQIATLAHHFRVIALDLKGFGDSDKPAWRSSYKIDTILKELAQFIHSLGVSSCTVIGHDLGALLGWYLVHQTPAVVKKFVTVSCPHPNIYWGSPKSQWLNYVQLPYLPEIDALKEDVKIIDQYFKHLDAKDVDAYKYTFSRQDDWTGPLNYYRNLPLSKIGEPLSRIQVPVLFILGGKDPFVRLENIVKSTVFCESFRLEIVDDCGHFPHQENPTNFNAILIKHLVDKVPDSRPDSSPSKRLINGLFGAMSTTVKYGNTMIGSVQKKTNNVVSSIPSFNLNYNSASQS